jgi:HprK-related kinase A
VTRGPAHPGATVETSRFACPEFDFAVRSTDHRLAEAVERLYAPLAVPGPATHRYQLVGGPDGSDRFALDLDGSPQLDGAAAGLALAHLVWSVNREVTARATEHVVVHAAAAERGGSVVVLPGAQGAGKSTLVAGLARAGFRYLTDEAVAIDLGTGAVAPYAKPIALEEGSLAALADLARAATTVPSDGTDQWLVPAAVLGPDAVSGGGTVETIVFPTYCGSCPTTHRPLPRAEALTRLVEHSFNVDRLGRRAFRRLVDVVRGATAHELELHDLAEGCAAVDDLCPPAVRARR